jgi:hypothetical protein
MSAHLNRNDSVSSILSSTTSALPRLARHHQRPQNAADAFRSTGCFLWTRDRFKHIHAVVRDNTATQFALAQSATDFIGCACSNRRFSGIAARTLSQRMGNRRTGRRENKNSLQ